LEEKLYLGNLDAKRDWGHSKDCVEAMWIILQQPEPGDYILATGKQYSVREFCELAFKEVGIDLEWKGQGVEEKGIDKKTGKIIIEVDPKYFRLAEVESLLGDPAKTREKLGWQPKITLPEMVKEMVASDLEQAKRDLYLKNGGFITKNYFE
jgi:GDPmannose 4,6-dehydratase